MNKIILYISLLYNFYIYNTDDAAWKDCYTDIYCDETPLLKAFFESIEYDINQIDSKKISTLCQNIKNNIPIHQEEDRYTIYLILLNNANSGKMTTGF